MIMKRLLLLLAAILTCAAANSHAAISVGPSGSGVLTFDALPAVTEWSTLSVGSFSSSFSDAAALDAAVMASTTAAFVNVALSQSAIIPPEPERDPPVELRRTLAPDPADRKRLYPADGDPAERYRRGSESVVGQL